MEPRRCAVHGLIAGEDGRCVICRRGEPEEQTPNTSAEWPLVVTLAVVAGLFVSAGGYWLHKKTTQGSTVDVPIAAVPPETPKVAPPVVDTPNPFAHEKKPWDPEPLTAEPPPTAAPEGPDPAQIEQKKRQVRVTMFMTPACSLCNTARLYFKSRQYSLKELDIQASPTDKVLLGSKNPAGTVPTFDVEGMILVGYDPGSLDAAIEAKAKAKLAAK